jgi:hypothetical protein
MIPRAQLAFKDSMVHGILQFTPRIAFRYVLHRCESRDIRCRESSRFLLWPRQTTQHLAAGRHLPRRSNIIPWRQSAPFSGATTDVSRRTRKIEAGRAEENIPPRQFCITCARVVFCKGNINDPSAGSPTETLLRLLLPLNDKVQWTSRDVTGGEPPASPRSEHFTGPFNR